MDERHIFGMNCITKSDSAVMKVEREGFDEDNIECNL